MEGNNQVKKNKSLKIVLIVLLVIILIIVSFGAGFFFNDAYRSVEDKAFKDYDDKKDDNLEEEIEVPEKNIYYTFYKEIKKEIAFGNVKREVIIYTYLDKERKVLEDGQEKDFYCLRAETFINGKSLNGLSLYSMDEKEEVATNAINDIYIIYNSLGDANNGDVYQLIKTNSLVYYDHDNYDVDNSLVQSIFIVNSSGEVIKKLDYYDGLTSVVGVFVNSDEINEKYFKEVDKNIYDIDSYPKRKDYFIYPDNRLVDVQGNYLYYLKIEDGNYDEYKLTINDGKVMENKINTYTYDDVVVAGQS